MGFSVYYSDPELTTQAGFGKVARLPCIFDSRPGYHRPASRYLIDRGLGTWNPETRGKAPRARVPGLQTMKNYAHWLANFLEWAERRGVDPLTCEYADHVQGRYQREMATGVWSRDGAALSPATINLRVQQACDYLTWLGDKGLREPFDIPTETVRMHVGGGATSAVGHRAKEVTRRTGKVKQNKRRLRMPTDDEVAAWLKLVYERFGYAKGLMCETVLCTGVRLQEVASWRIDTVPEEKANWHISNSDVPLNEQRVLVAIRYGTKGPTYGFDHDDKIGPERSIWLPRPLAEKLFEYRRKLRNPALSKWMKSGATAAERESRRTQTVHLFLSDEGGGRIPHKDLYNAWTGVKCPYKGWSPHLGRDWWACSTVWREVMRHEKALASGGATAEQLLITVALNVIRLQVQPQLGHAHDSTSMIYLQWVADRLGIGVSIAYDAEHEAAGADVGGKS